MIRKTYNDYFKEDEDNNNVKLLGLSVKNELGFRHKY